MRASSRPGGQCFCQIRFMVPCRILHAFDTSGGDR